MSYQVVNISQEQTRLVSEPDSDLLNLGGSLRNKALKNNTIKQVRQLEKQEQLLDMQENILNF